MAWWQVLLIVVVIALLGGAAALYIAYRRTAREGVGLGTFLKEQGEDLVRLLGRLRRLATELLMEGAVVMADKVPLSQLIDVVTTELRKAADRANQYRDHVMQFEECELEFAIEIERGGEAGIQVWVLKLGGGAKKTDSNTIRVKFTALPHRSYAFPALAQPPPQGEMADEKRKELEDMLDTHEDA
jgi:hypothetical protein